MRAASGAVLMLGSMALLFYISEHMTSGGLAGTVFGVMGGITFIVGLASVVRE